MKCKNLSKKAKNCYLLLELMIAFFLLSLFLAPLLHSPFRYLKKQQREITTFLLQIEEEKLFASIEENLRNGTIPWNTLLETEKHPIFLKSVKLQLPGDPIIYTAELSLLDGSFETEEEVHFGTVKAAILITNPQDIKKKAKPISITLFVLKAPPPSPYATT